MKVVRGTEKMLLRQVVEVVRNIHDVPEEGDSVMCHRLRKRLTALQMLRGGWPTSRPYRPDAGG